MKSFLKIAILSYTLLLLSISTIKAQCNHPDDYTALRALYLSTNGDNWTTRWGWPDAAWFIANPTMPPGTNWNSWFGVIGGCSGGRVRVLEIIGNNLTGPLPSEITLMTGLNELKIYANTGMSGPIPTNIGNLTLLTELRLSDNSHNGTIPSSVGSLINLNSLSFSNNQITGVIPSTINNLNQLTLLALNDNNLSGVIPNLSGLTILRNLRLQFNSLTGNIPNWINNSNFTDFRQLRLDFNQLSGTIPSSLGSLNLMAEMRLNNNNLEGCIPEELQDVCPSIASFNGDISNNPLLATQSWTDFCSNQEGMCQACGAHPDYAPLMALYNSTNGPGWTDNTGWVDGAAMTNCDPCNGWYGVWCNGNNRVQNLWLYSNNLTGPVPNQISQLTEVMSISFNNNNLNSTIPLEICNMSQLTELDLRSNDFVGSIPSNFGNLINLNALLLSNNQLTGVLPASLLNMVNIGTIALSQNQLTGSINNLANLVNTIDIHLNNNQFSGELPSFINNFNNLHQFNANNNNFSGTIPFEFGLLSNLENFVVNNNNLSGCIPGELQNLCLSGTFGNISNNPLLSTQSWTNFCQQNEGRQPIANAGPDEVLPCGGTVMLDGSGSSSWPSVSYLWSGPTGAVFTPSNTSQNPSVNLPGTYTLTVNNGNNCSATDEVVVTGSPPPPSPLINITPATCVGPGEAAITNFNIFYEYIFTPLGPAVFSGGLITNVTVGTVYTVVASENGCISPPFVFSIQDILPTPMIMLEGETAICSGESTTLSAFSSGGQLPYNYTWDNGLGSGNTKTVTPLNTTLYNVTVTDGNNCTAETNMEVTVNIPPDITIEIQDDSGLQDNDGEICYGGNIILRAYGDYNNDPIWSDGIQNDIQFSPTESTTYQVTITDQSGCTNIQSVEVIVYETLSYTLSPSNLKLCSDTIITFNPQQSVNALSFKPGNGLNGYTSGNKFIASPANSSCQNCTFDIEFTDNNSCAVKNSHTLSFGKSEVLSTTNVTTQGGSDGSATINVINGIAPFDVTVNSEPSQRYPDTPTVLDSLQEDTYNITVTDNGGCTTTASFVINGIDCPMVVSDSIEHIVCYGDSTGKILLTVTGAVGTISFNWQNNLGSSSLIESLRAGSYSVTITDDKCDIRKTYKVSQPLNPLNINANITHPGCGAWDGKITINPIGGWMPYDTIHPDTMLINQKAGDYSFYVMDSLGCRFDTVFTLLVTPGPNDKPSFINLPSDTTISCENAPQAGYMPTLTYGYPGCGVDSSGVIIASISIDGEICSGQTIVYRWEFRDTFEHMISHVQKVNISMPSKPIFIDTLADITINYSSLATTLQSNTLSYTNGENGVCSISGMVSSIDSLELMDCGGNVTRTWKALFCNDSITYIQKITVVKDDILPPAISCVSSNENSITFGWTLVPGAIGYNVEVISPSGLQGTIVGQNQYQFTNLSLGDSVTIRVEAILPGPCGNVISLPETCTALDCGPLPDVLIDIPLSFCISDQPFNLSESQVTINPPIQNSIGRFEINSVPVTQINLQELGPGTHNITYRLTWNNDLCSQVGDTTFEIYPVPSAEFTISSVSSCITVPTTVTYIGNAQGTTFNWDFGSDVIGSFSGQGPHQVTWTAPGTKSISLMVEKNGCKSENVSKEVEIENVQNSPSIQCETTMSSITFTWDNVPCTDAAYDLYINNQSVGSQTSTSYTISDLAEGEMVDFTLVTNSSCFCPIPTDSLTCEAKSCPPITVDVLPSIDTICYQADDKLLQLKANTTGDITSGQTSWLGMGITQNGIFDGNAAGIGRHVISYVIEAQGCTFQDSSVIHILDASSSISLDIITKDEWCAGKNDGYAELTISFTPPTQQYSIGWYDKFEDIIASDVTRLGNLKPGEYVVNVNTNEKCREKSSTFDIIEGPKPGTPCDDGDPETNGEFIQLDCTCKPGLFIEDDQLLTLNGDGVNEFLKTPGIEDFKNVHLTIVNRWGQKIFESKQYENESSWNGRYKDSSDLVADGAYYFIIKYEDVGGKEIIKTGSVTVVR